MPTDRQALAKLRRKQTAGLVAVAVELTNQAKVRATRNVDTGTRRNSITHTAVGPKVLWGISKRSAPHAPHLELGFRPHFVPMRFINLWARRRGVGQVRETSTYSGRRKISSRRYKRARGVRLGIFVGGPGSRLDYGPGGAQAYQLRGRARVLVRYRTKGQKSDLIPPGKVGHSVLRWTVKHRLRAVAPTAFARGYRNAR